MLLVFQILLIIIILLFGGSAFAFDDHKVEHGSVTIAAMLAFVATYFI